MTVLKMFSRYLGYNVFQRPPSKADGNVVLQFAKLMQFILNGGNQLLRQSGL